MSGLPSEAEQKTLQQLKAQLASGAVEMKVFTTAPLHGKTYIFHAPGNAFAQRRADVGSSNMTNAGFYRNLELNIDLAQVLAATLGEERIAALLHHLATVLDPPPRDRHVTDGRENVGVESRLAPFHRARLLSSLTTVA